MFLFVSMHSTQHMLGATRSPVICRPVRRGGSGGSDEPPRTAREFLFFVEDRKLLGITAREIVRVRTSVHRALTSYRDDMPKPEAVEKTVQVYRHVKTVFTCSGDKGV